MFNLKGHTLTELPIFELSKVSDLIEFDGAILSHFIDSKKNDYLYYWIDQDKNYNRWLVWKTEKVDLYKYLKAKVSLKDLLLKNNKEFIYSVDIDRELKLNNIIAVELDDCPAQYLPETESFYYSELTEFYENYFNLKETNLYLEVLREKALYFKLKPSTSEYSTTVGAIDAANFLKRICTSFVNFVEDDFFEKFKLEVTDYTKLKKIINEYKRTLNPRMTFLSYSSFEVGLSVDHTKSVGTDKYKDWQLNIFNDYKEKVVDNDFTSTEVLTEIKSNHSEDYIKRVILPFVDAVNNKEYKVETYNNDKTFKRVFKEISKQNKELITPKSVLIEEDIERKQLLNIVIELDKGKDVSQVSSKKLQSGLLFSQFLEKVEFPLYDAENDDVKIHFKKEATYLFNIDANNYYCCEIPLLDILFTATNKIELDKQIAKELANLFCKLHKSKIEDDLKLLEKFKSLIENYEFKLKPPTGNLSLPK